MRRLKAYAEMTAPTGHNPAPIGVLAILPIATLLAGVRTRSRETSSWHASPTGGGSAPFPVSSVLGQKRTGASGSRSVEQCVDRVGYPGGDCCGSTQDHDPVGVQADQLVCDGLW